MSSSKSPNTQASKKGSISKSKNITKTDIKTKPYEQETFAPHPTRFTRHMRTNILWQFFRFLVINWKMIKMARHH
jgi:hypothetical protein